jgi:cyanophycinase-like exopeptidase
VTFVDGSGVQFNNSADVTKGPELTISALRVGIIGTGQQFNLKRREIQALLTPLPAREIQNRVSSAR